jgi:molybdopterin-guanine dinucleotide biosynthesis protein A
MMDPHDKAAGASAIVLAGGRSSRMGRPKALLHFDNEPLIVHIVTALRTLCADVVVVGAPEQELPSLPAKVIRDAVAYQGPVGGICYGLGAIDGEVAIVVACDSAFLSLPLLSHLLDRIREHDVVVPLWGGRFQPLHAAYRRTVLPILEQQLARGELRPVDLFGKVRTLNIDEEEIRRFDPDGSSFFNMNTPEDYAQALERWGTMHGRPMRGTS